MKLFILTQAVDTNDPVLGFFHRWIEEFAKNVEQVTVICLKEGSHNLPENVKVLSLGKERGVSRLGYIYNFYTYITRERGNYDVVFVHMNQIYVLLGGLLWRLWGKRASLWYAHGHVPFSLRVATLFAHAIVTSTESGFRIRTKKKHVVGQGIDIKKFAPSEKKDDHPYTIISVGRMSPVKDYETLIQAVASLPDVRVLLVGGADTKEQEEYVKRLEKLVAEQGLSDRVSFVGSVPNHEVPRLLSESDLMVNTSHTGSLDKTMLEAMAMEVPVFTCNEAMREVLGEYQDMFLFPKKDVASLAEKIRSYKDGDEDYGAQMRSIVAEHHTVEGLIKKILKYV
ncbi:glycosyltransferase family 4 protein [Candidatus Kaiserbacteria bacterium]|nr:glycosyltransferase family 4 protein [Candidatus Kaiserbacteria bacterium]